MIDNFDTLTNNFQERSEEQEWVFVVEYLLMFYNAHKNENYKSYIEENITKDIYFWLKNEDEFCRRIVVNSEPISNNKDVSGFYDLKFEPRIYIKNDTHLTFENKIINTTSGKFKEYIHNPKKLEKNDLKYDDGGMFRFLSNKYSQNQKYGGMIGFVKVKDISILKNNLKEEIKILKIPNNDNDYGQMVNEHFLEEKILNFENSFQSNHTRIDGTPIHLYHLLFHFYTE